MTRSRRLAGAVTALVVVAALAVTAFIANSGRYPKLLWVGSSSGSSNIHPGPPSTTWVFGSFDPCVTLGPVTVTGFTFSTSSDLVKVNLSLQR